GEIQKKPKSLDLLESLKLNGKIIFGYAGNIGSAQGVDIILEAAKLTLDNEQIVYLIIGDGVEKGIIEKKIKGENITNVLLLPPISKDKLNDYLSIFDVQVIPLIKKELFTMTVPSKLYESMSAEIPVIICVNGEARKIVEQHKCGFYVDPENHKMLAETILKINDNRTILENMGINGRKAAIENFSKKKVVLDLFNNLNKE
ncbi:MAG: glycosyltransferase family 4 protein, partial [Melioribacteraceae bacterium]|nr:glycosyltransferase family 4 protein [Melioribacteraceae bacterium]